jgi:hypothetical protein
MIGFSLSIFFPAEVVTGTHNIIISPTESTSEFITTPVPILNSAFIFLFLMSSLTSIIMWNSFIEGKGVKKF